MDFHTFFYEYKMINDNDRSSNSFKELPVYKKVGVTTLILLGITTLVLLLFSPINTYFIILLFFISSLTILGVIKGIDDKKISKQYRLDNIFKPAAQRRINLITDLLIRYNIEPSDTERIDSLIDYTLSEQATNDILASLEKKLSKFTILATIVGFIALQLTDILTVSDRIYIATYAFGILGLILTFYYFCLREILRQCFCPDYYQYTTLLADLKNIKIFYSKSSSIPKQSPNVIVFHPKD